MYKVTKVSGHFFCLYRFGIRFYYFQLDFWTISFCTKQRKCFVIYIIVSIWHFYDFQGARVGQWVRSLDLTAHTSLSPIRRGFAPGFVTYKKWCTRHAAASDNVYQLLVHGRWFSPGTPLLPPLKLVAMI